MEISTQIIAVKNQYSSKTPQKNGSVVAAISSAIINLICIIYFRYFQYGYISKRAVFEKF